MVGRKEVANTLLKRLVYTPYITFKWQVFTMKKVLLFGIGEGKTITPQILQYFLFTKYEKNEEFDI